MTTTKRNTHRNKDLLTVSVDGIISDRRGRVLLIQRNAEPNRGYWGIPGGHLEKGETTEQAVIREVFEEVGLRVAVKKLIGVYSDPKRDPRNHNIAVAYSVRVVSGQPEINYEATDWRWWPLSTLPKKMVMDHRQILADYRKSLKK